jgi:hypothetical protein
MQPANAFKQYEAPCEARRRLAEKYATAARLYAEAVSALTGYSSAESYPDLLKRAEEAQQQCESTGVEFKEHVDGHQCSV